MKPSATVFAVASVALAALAGAARGQTSAPPAAVTGRVSQVSQGQGMVEAYQDLLKENHSLRQQATELTLGAERAAEESRKLGASLRSSEARIGELRAELERLQRESERPPEPAPDTEGAGGRDELERERARLAAEIETLRRELDERAAVPQPIPAPGTGLVAGAVSPGSPLFRRVEQENAELRQKLGTLEAERRAAEEGVERLRNQLEQREADISGLQGAMSSQQLSRSGVRKLVTLTRAMQADLKRLRGEIERRDAVIARERDVARQMRERLLAEQDRLRKMQEASGLMELLEQARRFRAAPDAEKRVLFRQAGDDFFGGGQYREAEREYLQALAIDPRFADVHYNLGVLYDAYLPDRQRAARHFRAYLDLAPDAPDRDSVRMWLVSNEMGVGFAGASTTMPAAEVRAEDIERPAPAPVPVAATPSGAAAAEGSPPRSRVLRAAQVLLKRDDRAGALALFHRAVEADPDFAEAHYNLGVLHDEAGNPARAARHYRRYLELRPSAPDSVLVKSWLLDAQMGL